MKNGIGTAPHPLDSHLTACGMQQSQHLGGAASDVLMRVQDRFPFGLPTLPRLSNSLIGSSLIFAPDGKSKALPLAVSRLNQVFFTSASGSTTSSTTLPLLRRRIRHDVPLWHQVRDFCHPKPASLRICQIV